MRDRFALRVLALSIASGISAGAFLGEAQETEAPDLDALVRALQAAEGGGSADELRAWALVRENELIEAREVAERVVQQNPRSYIGEFVLGYVQHYGEASFPRALFHLERARAIFEAREGAEPTPAQPWRWHARILRELGAIHGDLDHHEERLAFAQLYNDLYQPKILAERAWPLMKLRRFDEARAAAREGIESGDARQVEIALNALCAVEFEAGNDGASYTACRRALEHARGTEGDPNAVDLTNFAEAARSMFQLAEAESVLLEATRAPPAWYGNPWLELAALYTRGARYPEALSALKEIPGYRAQRPPHVQDADRNETRREIAAFLLAVGRPEEALEITDKALVTPDRRAHNSRDPAQDRALIALLDRRARRMVAAMKREQASAGSVFDRVGAWLAGRELLFSSWLAGRQAVRLLADDDRLVGTFRIGTARSAVMPPWLVGELVDTAGAGVVREAVRRARAEDGREGSDAYYDAFEAEAALAVGDEARAIELAARAREALGTGEAMLRARVDAIRAEATWREEGALEAAPVYDQVFQRDPGIFRRLDLEVPVEIQQGGGDVAEEIADALGRSPRFSEQAGGLFVVISADAASGRVCLRSRDGSELGCGEATPAADDDPSTFAQRVVDAFHAEAFSPQVDLSQSDIGSLDGSNRSTRNPLDTLLAPPDAP